MPGYRDKWDNDYRARRGPDWRDEGGGRFRREDDYGRGPARGRGPRYEYDDRDIPRGGARTGPRGDYDAYVYGRGDYYLDEDYYASRRGEDEGRQQRGPDTRGYEDERERRERRYGRQGDEDERRGAALRRRGAARSHLRCRDIMTRDVTVALRDTTLDEVARKMRDEDTGIIPVVEPNEAPAAEVTEQQRVPFGAGSGGRLVGLITDRDIVIRALAEGRDPREVRAEEVMSNDLHTALPNDRVIEVIRLMGDKQVRRIPVVDREGNLRGIISMADVALETEADRELAEALEEISSGHSFWNRIFG